MTSASRSERIGGFAAARWGVDVPLDVLLPSGIRASNDGGLSVGASVRAVAQVGGPPCLPFRVTPVTISATMLPISVASVPLY